MSGDEAKTTEYPDRRPRFGIASLVTPILGYGIGLLMTLFTPSLLTAAINGKIFWMLGLMVVGSIAGMVLSICSLRKRERWPFIAVVGLLVSSATFVYALT